MAATAAGDRDRRIEFRALTVTRGGMGVEVEAFAHHGYAMAKVLHGRGSERRDAAAAGAVQSATFRVLATTKTRAVTERFRIRDDQAREWGIDGIAHIGRTEIEFTATRIASV